ncbi:MAG: sugar ABC transporter permease [Candidatus Hydrogenedentes bacterium]|nr:sugar ABC transporter permease [Candidatus Hydrogenedentota bacterium]
MIFERILGPLDSLFDRIGRRKTGDAPLAAFLLVPAVLVLGVFGIYPLFFSIYISLFDLRMGRGAFCGLENYTEALTTPNFWHSLVVTLYFALGTIPVAMALSFLVASALFRIVRGRSILRTVYFLPYVTSVVAAATIWRVLLNPHYGLVNAALGAVGFEETRWSQWLLEPKGVLYLATGGLIPESVGPSLALCCVILFEIWHSSGFMIVILLAGMTAIPRELEESARIDGANWFQVTRRVTVPLLSPTIFFLLIISAIKAFQAFNSFYALTGDGRGPVNATQNMTVYIYASFFLNGREGYGAAVATLLSVAIVALTLAQWRFVGRKVYYE